MDYEVDGVKPAGCGKITVYLKKTWMS